jgi:hypothetical protein
MLSLMRGKKLLQLVIKPQIIAKEMDMIKNIAMKPISFIINMHSFISIFFRFDSTCICLNLCLIFSASFFKKLGNTFFVEIYPLSQTKSMQSLIKINSKRNTMKSKVNTMTEQA